MQKVSLHTFSFMMAFLVLLSTFSFTVEKHFCGKNLVGLAIFSSAEKCKSEAFLCGVEEMAGHGNMKNNSCCSDTTESVLGQDELNVYSVSFELLPPTIVLPSPFTIVDRLPEASLEIITYPPYEPPQLVYDLQVLCQVFTI